MVGGMVKNTARVDVLSWKPSFFQIVIDQEPFLAMGTMATHQSMVHSHDPSQTI